VRSFSLGILISVLVSVCVKLYSCCCASVLDAWADSGHCVDECFVGWLLIYFLLLCLPYPVIASFLSLDFFLDVDKMVYTGKPSRGCQTCKSRRIKVRTYTLPTHTIKTMPLGGHLASYALGATQRLLCS
jgi:hypothetical protein